MNEEKPLLFIDSPVIQKFFYSPSAEEESTSFEDESTSVFEPEHTRKKDRVIELPGVDNGEITEPADSRIRQNIEYLHHPFRKELYQPLEFITENETFKGKVYQVDGGTLLLEQDGNIIEVKISDVLDIRWKQQSFDR